MAKKKLKNHFQRRMSVSINKKIIFLTTSVVLFGLLLLSIKLQNKTAPINGGQTILLKHSVPEYNLVFLSPINKSDLSSCSDIFEGPYKHDNYFGTNPTKARAIGMNGIYFFIILNWNGSIKDYIKQFSIEIGGPDYKLQSIQNSGAEEAYRILEKITEPNDNYATPSFLDYQQAIYKNNGKLFIVAVGQEHGSCAPSPVPNNIMEKVIEGIRFGK